MHHHIDSALISIFLEVAIEYQHLSHALEGDASHAMYTWVVYWWFVTRKSFRGDIGTCS